MRSAADAQAAPALRLYSRRAFCGFGAWLCLGTTTMAADADDFAWFLAIPPPADSHPPSQDSAAQMQRALAQISRFVSPKFVVAAAPAPRYFSVAPDTTIIMVRKRFASDVAELGANDAPFDAPDLVGSGLSMLQVFERGWLWRKQRVGVAMTDTQAGQSDAALVVYFVLDDKR